VTTLSPDCPLYVCDNVRRARGIKCLCGCVCLSPQVARGETICSIAGCYNAGPDEVLVDLNVVNAHTRKARDPDIIFPESIIVVPSNLQTPPPRGAAEGDPETANKEYLSECTARKARDPDVIFSGEIIVVPSKSADSASQGAAKGYLSC